MSDLILPFVSGFLLSGALIAAIGAQNLFVLQQGLRREHVGAIVLFCGSADALLIAAGVAGMGAFLAAIPQLAAALACAGAAFLFVYGCKAFRRMAEPGAMTATGAQPRPLQRALATAAAFTFLNPHVYLDTVLLMGTAGAGHAPELRGIFVLGAATASFLWFAGLGFGARLLAPVFARPASWRILDGLVGVTMWVLALSLVLGVVLR